VITDAYKNKKQKVDPFMLNMFSTNLHNPRGKNLAKHVLFLIENSCL